MCLSSITKEYKKPDNKVRFAYKVLYFRDEQYGFLFYPSIGANIAAGKWTKADSVEIFGAEVRYKSGFHCFVTRKAAKDWSISQDNQVVVKVRVRGIHTTGKQSGLDVLVAHEMYVPRPRKIKQTSGETK